PNGTTAEHTYDGADRVATIDNRHNVAAQVSRFEYSYDLNGNRIQQIETHGGDPSETTVYGYDGADRLLVVTYPDKITSYTYDAAGNRLTETETDLAGEAVLRDRFYDYNDRNQLAELTDLIDPSASVTYGFDANGNQISRVSVSGETTVFAFDIRDRIVEVTLDGTSLGVYGYDYQGLRVTKESQGAGLERYVYDQQSVLLRIGDSGRTAKYDYGSFRLLAVDDSVDGRGYYLFDALGSVSELTTPV
ncbi:MAG: RHS repeat protein, partial [Actinomycetia bacterium]|nr:RHS repeat protein [Actinomycetes bacterium]